MTLTRLCDCGCGSSFSPPPSAPHKRFFSDTCRTRWHQRERAKAVQAWKGLESEASAEAEAEASGVEEQALYRQDSRP